MFFFLSPPPPIVVTADAFDNVAVSRFEQGGVLSFLFGFSRYTLEFLQQLWYWYQQIQEKFGNQGISKVN